MLIDQLRPLAIFAKTVDHGSFRAAAKELRLSPSVVSHHIAQLEDHLGTALLHRSTRKLKLTPDGERLLASAHGMLAAVEDELLSLTASTGDPSGELRVTAPSVLSKSHLIDMLAAFMKAYPRIRLTLDFTDERRNIIEDGFDIAIRMAVKVPTAATTRQLFQVRRKLIAAPDFIDCQSVALEPKDLREWPWLELSPVRNLPARFRQGDVEQTITRKEPPCSCNDAQGLYRLALSNTGLAVVPEFLVDQNDISEDRIRLVLPDWELEPLFVFADWPSNAPRFSLINLFLEKLGGERSTD